MLRCERVSVRYASRAVGLADVTLDVAPGEVVTVVGSARSGRTTLIRVLAGVQPPSSGTVAFDGRPPSACLGRPGGIGWARHDESDCWPAAQGATAIEQVRFPLLLRMGAPRAALVASAALERVGAQELADEPMWALGDAERVRVGVARALVAAPRLLLCDRPLAGVAAPERDGLLRLFGALAREGVAVVFTADEARGGATRVLTIHRGRLRGEGAPAPAAVIRFPNVRHAQ